ncbi:MAG: GNAT family N-acetyltransferase [Vicinamibacteria bacterium]|nr:GNAT family N-acetyltransferase [Vicinamibacteria bacterium]
MTSGAQRRPLQEVTLRTVSTEADVRRSAELLAGALASDEYERIYSLFGGALNACPYVRRERSFLWEAGGRVVGRLQLLDLGLQIGETLVPAAGISGLVIDPQFFGIGLALRFGQTILDQIRADGAEIAIGFTATRGYYERFAGVTVTPDYALTFEAPLGAARGDLRELTPEELPHLLRLYQENNVGRTGVLVRSEVRWPWLYQKSDRYLLSDSGYAGLRLEDALVHIDEIGGSASFFDELVSWLPRITGLPTPSVRADIPPDHPFAAHAERYGAKMEVTLRASGGGMARIINVPNLLKRLEPVLSGRYLAARPDGPSIRLTLAVENSEAICVMGDPARGVESMRVMLPGAVLTRLVFGTLPAPVVLSEAALAAPDSVVSLLSLLFPRGYPHTWRADKF